MSAKDAAGVELAIDDAIKLINEIYIPQKGKIPAGTALKVKAFGRGENHIDVEYGGKLWFIDAVDVKKS